MRHARVWSITLGMAIAGNSVALAQEKSDTNLPVSLTSGGLILDDEPQEFTVEVEQTPTPAPAPAPALAPKAPAKLPRSAQANEGTELIQTVYPNGSPRISKQVALDPEGNYVNHGEYQEWSEAGGLLLNGHYDMGKQTGVWIRTLQAKESKLFESEPYKRFKAPFQSTAVFEDGKLHGLWAITDKEGNKVSEIQLSSGKRDGLAVWYNPSGTVLWQSEYTDGVLHGTFVEKDAAGKVTRQTQFINGRKVDKKSESYANKKTKSEYQFLTAPQALVTPDNWNTTTLAVYKVEGEEIRSGLFTTFYEGGSVRSQTNYVNGIQDGEFLSWYSNNQRESAGRYSNGRQSGKWSWWHENGMRKATATYENGAIVGTVLAWNDQGIKINPGDFAKAQSEAAKSVPGATEKSATNAKSPQQPARSTNAASSRSASNSRRPGSK
jgi:antitoxin component YwqK of YwqJK toxin-antitoxin module